MTLRRPTDNPDAQRATVATFALMVCLALSVCAQAKDCAAQTPSIGGERTVALVAEGVSALERGDTEAARKSFESALKIEPTNVTAHTYLCIMADRAGDLSEAERHFSAAAIADPLSPTARNNHGAILLRLGRVKQAATQFETSLRLDKNQPAALINLAQIRFASNTPEGLREARDFFERARAIAPDAEIARSLVVIALRLKDRDAAAAYYLDYAARLSDSTSQINTPQARAEMGAAMLDAGLINEATKELSAAVNSDSSNVNAILFLAQAYMAGKDINAAGRTLEGALARGVEAAPIYAALADIYQSSGHLENAIPAMRLAIERDPKNEFYRFRYGMLLTDTQAPAAAIIRLQESLKEFPSSARLWFALGVAQFRYRKHDEAAVSFQHAIELDPKFAPALAYLGMTYDETAQYAPAITLYERAVTADENLAAAHYLLADALLRQPSTDMARAEAQLARAVELDPSFAPGRLALAKLYVRLKRYAEAAAQLEQVVAAAPDLAEGHYQLGHVYARLKRTVEAEKEFAIFKQLGDKQQGQVINDRQELVRRLANVRF
jgi:Tfp pilus assembly protein PilF